MRYFALIFIISLLAVFTNSARADANGDMLFSQKIELWRECFVSNKNCAQLTNIERNVLVKAHFPSDRIDDALRTGLLQDKTMFNKCPEAKVNLSTIRSESQIIVHNFLLEECFQSWFGYLNNSAISLDRVLNLGEYFVLFRQTQYQLGHIKKQDFEHSVANESALYKVINETNSNLQQKTEQIKQLKAQLAELQSADHDRCRKIEAIAAMNGATPQPCP
jgi:hypothetical protein